MTWVRIHSVAQKNGLWAARSYEFKDTSHEVIVWPDQYKSGAMIDPYAEAKKP